MPTDLKGDIARAAVLSAPGERFEIRSFPVPSPEPGGVIVRTACCTICGSDVHAWTGARPPAFLPAILGHEVAGTVVDAGNGAIKVGGEGPLRPGDRVTFTLTASCGQCFYCSQARMPQKCESLFKYGHTRCDGARGLTGGLADYIHVVPGSTVYRIPDGVSDEVAASAMCAGATLAHALEGLDSDRPTSVLLLGMGMLGLWGLRFARDLGIETVVCCDLDRGRLDYSARWGATEVVSAEDEGHIQDVVRARTDGRGVDLCVDLTGKPDAVAVGIRALRTGGTMKLVGSVVPSESLPVDPFDLVTRALTVQGIHNYRPEHLGQALDLAADPEHLRALFEAVGTRYSLVDVDTAFEAARDRVAHRVAVVFH